MIIKRLKLGLIHIAVAMTLVPINSTLNRVMIKELALAATLVAALASLPYLFSPMQVWIGSFSDRHPLFGWRRTPYIFLGLLLCVTGVIVSPHAAFLMGTGKWTGILVGVLAFGAWGMGFNLASVSYFSLASEISGEKGRGRTVAVMFFMMIVGIIMTAITLSRLVEPYTPEALVRAFNIIGTLALVLGLSGIIGLEKKSSGSTRGEQNYTIRQMADAILTNPQAKTFFWYLFLLLIALLGQDVLLEPFAAETFQLSVAVTTRITSIWGVCVLITLVIAGALEGRLPKRAIAQTGNYTALSGLVIITISGLIPSLPVFYAGVILLGLGTGLSTVANLSLMLDMTTARSVGVFIGAWGMANAFSRLFGALLGGAMRDWTTHILSDAVLGYVVVFAIEALLLLVAIFLFLSINVAAFQRRAEELSLLERTSLTNS